MDYPKILVTDANHIKALAVVRALSGMDVYTTDASKHTIVSCSKFSKGHFLSDINNTEGFVDRILEICKTNDIKVVITPEERSSLLVARNESRFTEAGIFITTPPISALEIAMDKSLTIKAALETDILAPETKEPTSIEEAKIYAKEIGYPLAVKPRFSYYWNGEKFLLGKGTSYVNNEQQLESIITSMESGSPMPLLQKYVNGYGRGIFLAINKSGQVVAQFAHERIRDLNPTGSGSSLRKSIPVDPILLKDSVKLLRHIGWYGVAMVEYRIDPEAQRSYLMEINGRFWGSLQLANDSGVNFPKAVIDIAMDNPIEINEYKCNVLVRWWLGDLIRLLLIFQGRPAGFTGDFPSRWQGLKEFFGPQPCGTLNEVFRWYDPVPSFFEFSGFISKKFKKVIRKCFCLEGSK